MSLNLTTLGRLAALILFLCVSSSAPAEVIDNQINNPFVTTGIAPLSVSETSGVSNPVDKASPCLTGLCPLGVWALCEYNGDLYAGGQFTSADGQTTKYIARWDGSRWYDVGGGMNHYVYDLLVYDGKLIVGGVFDTVNGVPMGHIAAWDGVSWTPLGEGINRRPGITDMIIYNGDIIVSGTFDSAGSVATPNIAKWNGTSWEAFGPGGNFGFRAMTIFQGDLILSNAPDGGFSRWNGSSWTTIPTPINGGVYGLDVYNDQLIAGGFFVTAGEDTVNHIIAWDGVNWTPLDGGIGPEYAKGSNVSVQSLFNYQGDLIVGGNFTFAGGDTANYIARWDGASWHPIGGGMGGSYDEDHWVTALTEYNGELVAGGYFTTAEGLIVNRIAAWDGDTWRPLTAQEGMPFAIEIDNNQAVVPGAMVSIPVTKIAGSGGIYGFDLLIAYDTTYTNFIGADPGILFDMDGDYQWEYFNYQADTGFIHIVALGETNNGAHHPLSGDVPNGAVLFDLNFMGGEVGAWGYATVDLEYYWQDCSDNTILTDSLGYDLAISDSVYDADGINVTDHSATFPANTGAPDECLGGGPTPVTRLIDFYGGKLYVADTTQIDMRGDINLNGIPYEIADWVTFLNYFREGLSAFDRHIDASIAASDINADGIVLDISDLYYLYRIICGDFLPFPGKSAASTDDTLRIFQDLSTRTVSFDYADSLGALCCVFMGDITPTFLVDTSLHLCSYYYNGKSTVVLVLPPDLPYGNCGIGLQPGPLFTYSGQGKLIFHDIEYRVTSGATGGGAAVAQLLTRRYITGDADGGASMDEPMYGIPRSLARISNAETLAVHVSGFTEHDITDVDLASVRVNDTIKPISAIIAPGPPSYMEIVVAARDFIHSYAFVPDTTEYPYYWPSTWPPYMFWNYVYSVRGDFTDASTFTALGEATITNGTATIPVPSGWPTVGEAVAVAFSGDTVMVGDGVYSGEGNRDLMVYGKNLYIKSDNGPEATIIDCGGSESEHHYFLSYLDSLNETSGRLEGFTIRNAYGDNRGAVYIDNGAPTIRNCRYENNSSTGSGGAINIVDASPDIEYCLFDNNHAVTGGAIAASGTGAPFLANCTFVANSADGSGGGLYADGAVPSVTNCIFAFGTAGGAIGLSGSGIPPSISCTDIYGNTGGDWTGYIADQLGQNNNFSADPLFCDVAGGDYRLDGLSPCTELNNTCYELLGAYGPGCGYLCGDASGDSRVNIGDVVFLINYIFRGGPAPENTQVADLNGDGGFDVGDAVVLVDFIFRSGPPLDCQPE